MKRLALVAFAFHIVLSMKAVADAHARLYQRPEGAAHDFVYCTEPTSNTLRKLACGALGLLQCQQRVTGNAFLVSSTGTREVIVTASHALIDAATGKPFKDCVFLLHGTGSGIPIDQAVLFNSSAHTSSAHPDIAAAQLSSSYVNDAWTIPLQPANQNEIRNMIDGQPAEFSLVAIHPSKRVPVTTAYDCAPVPKERGHREWWIQSELNHNCPAIAGFSGSPGMIYVGAAGRYFAVCIERSGLGPRERLPFDPTVNPNTCTLITNDLVEAVNRLARGEFVETPAGGEVVRYEPSASGAN